MSKIDKLKARMRQNPRDWRLEELITLAEHYGFGWMEGKGSHTKLYHPKLVEILTVPAKRPIKPIYVKQLLMLIERLEEMK